MSILYSPGIVTRDIDFSSYVSQQSSCVAGIIGGAERGPVEKLTLCTGVGDFINKFGQPVSGDFGSLAAIRFLNNGNKLWYYRTAKETAAVGTTSFDGMKADGTTSDAGIITVTSKEKGIYANSISVKMTSVSALLCELEVSYKGIVQEILTGSADKAAEDAINKIVSNWINIAIKDTILAVTLTMDTKALTGGSNGFLEITDVAEIVNALDAFSSPDECDINILSVPGWSDTSVILKEIAIAEGRADCIAIIDPPIATDVAGMITFVGTLNSSAAAIYFPWVKIMNNYVGVVQWVPPSVEIMGIYATNDNLGNIWSAPAGLNRGKLTMVQDVELGLTQGDRDSLYKANINPLVNYKGLGFVVWGQKTLLKKTSALDRVNVKRLMCSIKKAVSVSTAVLLFEGNNSITWDLWLGMITPYLRSIRDAGGLYDFKVEMGETTVSGLNQDAGEMPGRVYVKPTKTAEFIPIDFILKASGDVL